MAKNSHIKSPFQVIGPFGFDKSCVWEIQSRNDLWKEIDGEHAGLSEAQGVYLFSLSNGNNFVPQYVGITHKQSFRKEVFNKANLLNIVTRLKKKGRCQLHLIAKPKNKHSGYSKITRHQLNWLEQSILFSCLTKNPHMINLAFTKFFKSVEIGGVTGNSRRGKPTTSISTFKNAINLN